MKSHGSSIQRHFCRDVIAVSDTRGVAISVLLKRQQIFPEIKVRGERKPAMGCGKTASEVAARRHFLYLSRLLCCPFPRGLFFYFSEQPSPHQHHTILHCPLVWQTLL